MSAHEKNKLRVEAAVRLIQSEARAQPLILVFGLGSFGDVLQTTGLLRALGRKFPQAKVILIHADPQGENLLAHSSLVHRYLHVPSPFHYYLRCLLQPEMYDLMAEVRYGVKYTLSEKGRWNPEELAFLAAAQEEQIPWLGYVQNFPHDNDLLWQAAQEKGWSMYDLMAHTAGFGEEDFEDLSLELAPDESVREKFALPAHYIIVSNAAEWLPVSSNLWTKCLPHERMQEVLLQLKAHGVTTVLLGTKNDPGRYDVTFDLRGQTKLPEVAHLIQQAQLVLGPEGGLINLAQAVKTSAVVFFGSTPPEFFAFKNNTNLIPEICGGCWWTTETYLKQCPLLLPVPACTHSISADRIVRAVEAKLAQTEVCA